MRIREGEMSSCYPRKVTHCVKRSGTKKQASMDKEPERIAFETRMSHRNPTTVGYQPIRVWTETLISRSPASTYLGNQ